MENPLGGFNCFLRKRNVKNQNYRGVVLISIIPILMIVTKLEWIAWVGCLLYKFVAYVIFMNEISLRVDLFDVWYNNCLCVIIPTIFVVVFFMKIARCIVYRILCFFSFFVKRIITPQTKISQTKPG